MGIYGGPSNSGFDATGPALNQSPGLNYSHIFSPTLVTEVRFGVVRNRNDATNVDTGTNLSQKFGIPNGNIGGFWYQGLAEVFVNGYDTPLLGVNGCLPWRALQYQLRSGQQLDQDQGHARHLLGRRLDARELFPVADGHLQPARAFHVRRRTRPRLHGASQRSHLTLSPRLSSINLTGSAAIWLALSPVRDDHVYALYFHDKWQATSKLTLDLGARWEYWPASYPQFPGGQFNYDPNTNSLLAAGYGNIPMNLGVKNYPKNVYPRIGLAYRLNDKTVIRAGFAMSSFYRYIADWQGPINQNQQLDRGQLLCRCRIHGHRLSHSFV